MKFYIITPTYKRIDDLLKAIKSVINQTYIDWQMIIVNDSPSDTTYKNKESEIKKDNRITYLINSENKGVNFSRNRAIDTIEKKATSNDWVIFLDDDDTLEKEALETLVKINKENPDEKWILTNRASYDGVSFTKISKTNKHYHYILDFLLIKKLKGDATHCINAEIIKNIRFPKLVKQGEEWLFYYELALKINMFFYVNHNCTLSNGYSPDGLNFRKRTKKERFLTLLQLTKESYKRKIIWHPTLLIYLLIRFVLILFK